MFSSSGFNTPEFGAPRFSMVAASTASFEDSISFESITLLPAPVMYKPDPVMDEAAKLIAFIAQGCEASFKQLVKTSRNRLFAIIYRVNTNEAQAEEILQDVYLKVWTSSDRFSSLQGNGYTWLNALARNAAIDSLRRNACRPVFEISSNNDEDDAYDQIESCLDGPLQILIASRRDAYLDASVKLLAVEDKRVVKMSFFDELSHQQIATRLGKPLGSIKTRIRRALLKMQLTTPLDA